MKRFISFLMLLSFVSVFVSACTAKHNEPLIKSQRKLDKYLQQQDNKSGAAIDLSEGPKLNYDANFGPKNLNFDFKIETPY